jgi:tetratricopeptide (TPR) repeat protein
MTFREQVPGYFQNRGFFPHLRDTRYQTQAKVSCGKRSREVDTSMDWKGGVLMRAICVIIVSVLVAGCSGSTGSNNPPGTFGRAEKDEFSAARTTFETVKEPDLTANTRFAAGQLAESQGSTPNAIIQYREAIKIDPSHQQALYRLGVLYAEIKDYPNAIEIWKQYIIATNGSATGYANLGFCDELAGRLNDAERAYQAGIAKETLNQQCRINYGLMLTRTGRANEAVIQLQTVLKPAEVHYNMASVYEQQKKSDLARAEYRKALELDPAMMDARTRLAELDVNN